MDHPTEGEAAAYYRLRQVNLNGSESFSTIEYTIFDANEIFNLEPNPANGNTYIRFTTNKTSPARIEIRDLNGRLVHKEEFMSVSGSNNYEINLNYQQDGVYFLTLITATKTSKSKLIMTSI